MFPFPVTEFQSSRLCLVILTADNWHRDFSFDDIYQEITENAWEYSINIKNDFSKKYITSKYPVVLSLKISH